MGAEEPLDVRRRRLADRLGLRESALLTQGSGLDLDRAAEAVADLIGFGVEADED